MKRISLYLVFQVKECGDIKYMHTKTFAEYAFVQSYQPDLDSKFLLDLGT